MNRKSIISMILSILMILQIFITPVSAISNSYAENINSTQKSEGQKIGPRSEIFEFSNKNTSRLPKIRRARSAYNTMSLRSTNPTRTETAKLTVSTEGLSSGTFNWDAFGANKSFKAWIEVQYSGEQGRVKASDEVTISSSGDKTITVQTDSTKTVENYYIRTQYDTDVNRFNILAFFDEAAPIGAGQDLKFELGIYQVVNTNINYKYVDEYGNVITKDTPAQDELKNKAKLGEVKTFDIKTSGSENLWQSKSLDEWDLMDSSIDLTLTAENIKSNGIDYKLSKTYDVNNGGTITIKRQKPIVTPEDPNNPGEIPEGYGRLVLNADEKSPKTTKGTFTLSNPNDKIRVVDVIAGTSFNDQTVQDRVKGLGSPEPLTKDNQKDTGKVFSNWSPRLDTLGNAVSKVQQNLNAAYMPSDLNIDFDIEKNDDAKAPRHNDEVVKGKITSQTEGTNLEGAKVVIKDNNDKVIGITLANKDGSFVAGTRPLIAGEELKIVVTLSGVDTESAPVKKQVKLNPDDLNKIIPMADKVLSNFNGKTGIKKAQYEKLAEELKKGKALVDEETKKPVPAVTVDKAGQDSLDNAYKAIKTAIEALTTNSIPVINAPDYKEIFKGDALDLTQDVTVSDADGDTDLVMDGENKFSYKITKNKEEITDVSKINQTPGTYIVEYTAKDKSGATATHTMTLVVKKDVIEVPGEFPKPEDIPEGYVKVEFLAGDHGTLEGTTKFLVKNNAPSTVLNAPEIIANENFKVKTDKWNPTIPTNFATNFETTAQYEYTGKNVVPQDPGEDKPSVPDDFVKVEFKAGEHGKIVDGQTTIYWVKPNTDVNLSDKAPKVTANVGWKQVEGQGAWNPAINAAKQFSEKTNEIVAQYEYDVDTSDQPKEGYSKVTFDALDKGTIDEEQTKVIYVNPAKDVTLNAPTVTPKTGYTFKAWDPTVNAPKKYVNDERIIATYNSDELVSETEKEGYIKVTFAQGENGTFTDTAAKKDFWIKPDTLVDLRSKAPKVTANDGYVHTGWDKDLVQTFTKTNGDQTITAKYELDSDFSYTEKEGFTKITFSKGDHGEFAQNAKTELWVNPAKELTLPVPGIVPNPGYSHTGWNPAVTTAKKYENATTITATYDSDISDTEKDGFVKVTFKPGTNGTFEVNATERSVWVNPNKEVNLTNKAPVVTPKSGYIFTKWNHDLVAKFSTATEITAQYASAGDIKTEETEGFTKVTFDKGDHGEFVKDATTVYWVNPEKDLVLPAPGIVAAKGYTHTGWNPALTPAKKYANETTIKATYQADTSDTQVEGFNKVTFETDAENGTFENNATTKDVWVKPDTLVDLTDKAPNVTAVAGKTHTGWDRTLIGTFANNSKIKATYSSDVSDKPVEGWTEITFNQGDHGKFADGAKNVLWVNPEKAVVLDKAAPVLVPDINYSFAKWVDAQNADADLTTAKKYTVATSFTATYESDFSDQAKEGFVKITFKPGDNGKFAEGSTTEIYVRENKEVDLTGKAPTIMPNAGYGHTGWKPALKGTFAKATDIVAQYKAGTFDENNIKEITVIAPTKMAYGEGDQLNLTGMKVIAKDNAGLLKTYDGVDAITKAGFSIAPANETNLTVETHNAQPIVVTKGEGQDKIEGQTQTVISVDANLSAKPEDVKALNQNKVDPQTKKVTDEPKDTTTVTGKVKPGATVKIYDNSGKDITPSNIVYKTDGNFTAEVEKQEDGAKVTVKAQEPGKNPSEAKEATVARDANNDGKADDDVNQKTAIPTATALNKGENPTSTTITGKATPNSKVVAKVGETIVGETTANGDGDYTIEAKQNGKPLAKDTEVKVTAQAEGKLVSDPTATVVKIDKDGNGKADDEEDFDIKKATNVEILSNPDKMDYLVNKKDEKATFDTTGLVIKLTDAAGNTAIYTSEELKNENGITLNPAHGAELGLTDGTEFTVTVIGADAQNKPTVKADKQITVKLDADNDGKADVDDTTERPAALAYNFKDEAFTTITGETEKGAIVTAKVGDVKVGTATADSEGNYKIEATKDGEKLPNGTKVTVTAIKAPKGESLPQTTTVYDDKDGDGQPDSSQAFDISKATGMEVVASPDKMVYNNEEVLNLNGLKVLLTDVNGNKKLFTYNHDDNTEFTKAGLSVDYKQGTKLTSDDNDKKLTVTLDTTNNKFATETINGETPTALKVNPDQTAQPTDVIAANQGDKKVTTVKGKATKGSEIKIVDELGNSLLPEGTSIKVGDNGEFETDLSKQLNPGEKVFVTATEPGKTESSKVEAKVFRDKNSDGKPDTGAKLTKPEISPIRENDENVIVDAPNAEDKIKTITVEDQNGNAITLTRDEADKSGKKWKVEGSNPEATVTENSNGKLVIPVKDTLPLNDRDQIKVTFKDGENPSNEIFDKAPVQKSSQKPTVEPVYTGDKNVKIVDPTIADPTAKTIKVKVNEEDSLVIEKQEDGSWKIKSKPNEKVEVVDGKVVVPLDPSAKKGDTIKVSTINDSKVESPAETITVEDKVLTQKPTVDKANKDENTVSGIAAPGAKVTVTVTPKNGEPKTFIGEADKEGNYKVTTDTLVDGDKVVVTASEPGKADNTSDPKVVGVDTSKLKESIDKAEEIGGNDGSNLDENKPIDKALKDALKEGKETKKKGDKNDPTVDQSKVDRAKEELDKAIAQKEADNAVDKAKDSPTSENIQDAQDKIDAIPGSKDSADSDYNPIKKELQDKLDLIKVIKEAEDRLKKDDIKDKPDKDVQDLKDSVTNGKDNLENNQEITESIQKIKEALDRINKESLTVMLKDTRNGSKVLDIRTSAPRANVEIKINGKSIKTITTDSLGQYVYKLDNELTRGDRIELSASKAGYLDGTHRKTIY
ncbi:hypothetical protein KQI68_10150 [Peptoniphilus sp. MSJ-1]|uniref:Bacterial Ig domain-containing protein n=1 Tax=Peptoniphilus ovalis TaxID=2841503 RepID=A0ABS6FJ35_9FIRM|nr:Ig-like domain-containing protein [Peptoniphilus ovalis]MBU5670191.1 hypothetical protein [Peptoniphilus ovalis]